MKKDCKIIVRDNIRMPWIPTDNDLKAMDCYYESPVFCVDATMDIFDILDFAYDKFSPGFSNFRNPKSVELIAIN